MSFLTDSLAEVEAAIAVLPSDAGSYAALSDDELMDIPAALAGVRQRLEVREAVVAGEIARRSGIGLGYRGLAQKSGFRTPEKLVQHLTGSTGREAGRLVRTGVIIHEAAAVTEAERAGVVPGELTRPWLAVVGRAVAAGTLSLDHAEAIRVGLGATTADIAADVLADAAERLVGEALVLNADQVLDRARLLRDELDAAGIADRERALRLARSFRRYRRGDGMTVYTLAADPESATYLDGIYDALTSPRRGGPRMVDADARAREAAIEADPRSTEQLAFDGIMAVLRIGVATDEKTAAGNVLGVRRPAVRVLVTQQALDAGSGPDNGDGSGPDNGDGFGPGDGFGAGGGSRRHGHGRLEGHAVPVSIETVERIVCESGIVPVLFDTDGQCVDLGREERLYTARQRIGLAARDGGCRWPGCDRPASWSEAHHINQWARDGGRTDLADGILLCRHHHLLLHNNHWDITRTGGQYWLLPPVSEDPDRTPRPMPHKSAALGDLEREQARREAAQQTG